jgi:hypothetical protein
MCFGRLFAAVPEGFFMPSLSLIEAFALVPDPRKPRGRRHPLTAILALTTLAILGGCHSLEAIAQFGRDHGLPLAHALGFRRKKTPSKSSLSRLFRRLDIDAFENALRLWLQGRLQDGGEAIALDGKVLKGSADGPTPGVHLLSAFVPAAAAVLAQIRVATTTNEHKAAFQLPDMLPLRGKVVTGDAIFTQRDLAGRICLAGGDYVLIAKDNQAELKAHIQAALQDDAAFSPLPTPAAGGGRADGADGRQGARPAGDPPLDEYDVPERVSGLARGQAGLRAGAGACGGGQVGGGGGLRSDECGSGAGRRRAVAGLGAGPLGDREAAARGG